MTKRVRLDWRTIMGVCGLRKKIHVQQGTTMSIQWPNLVQNLKNLSQFGTTYPLIKTPSSSARTIGGISVLGLTGSHKIKTYKSITVLPCSVDPLQTRIMSTVSKIQLSNRVVGDVKGLRALPTRRAPAPRFSVVRNASGAAAEDVPDMNKRNIMNLLLLGAAGLPIGTMAVPYLAFFVPKSSGGGAGGQTAKDALGNDIKQSVWIQSHKPGDKSLSQGLKGDPTYLLVTENNEIEKFGINAVCTHLGCVVPWNAAENKFMCPCHGSQYNNQGRVVRGPAPLSLALAHCDVQDDVVVFSPWTETDFRTGLEPWWK
eukprot:TRINITY_DN28483_c0_g1_i2.p1 TRINITY_DN28483_c0_g1~~TRINITY_DN28483_c0_g1_i2.p1  ORF type:complete len:315 (-),score=27.68 TRINITY_DN28483_c0_g1_i2:275-1219(-)